MATSKSRKPTLDPGDEVVGADDVGAGLLGLAGRRRRRRTPPPARTCRCRGAARRCRGSSGRPCGGRPRAGTRPRRSRRTCAVASDFTSSNASSGGGRTAALAVDDLAGRGVVRTSCPVAASTCTSPSTSMPIERAVPATCAIAPSRSMALRSGILVSAIWRTCASVTLPTFSVRAFCGALLDAGGLLEQERRRRRLGDERERPVLVDRDLGRDHHAALVLGRGVVRLAEVHDVDAVRTERGTDRRRGRRLRRPGSGSCTIAANFFFAMLLSALVSSTASRPGRTRARPGSRARRCSRAP